ncbi:MAG: hypothetical protein M0Z59_05680 [Nitrospiraceae bacterium]|nr:hypothetical protein [Nitrospiraceae bacterium]
MKEEKKEKKKDLFRLVCTIATGIAIFALTACAVDSGAVRKDDNGQAQTPSSLKSSSPNDWMEP